MVKFNKWILAFASLLLLDGCASSISVIPLSDIAKKESTENAVPYYLPMPCILVTKNMSITSSVITAPISGEKLGQNDSTKVKGTKTAVIKNNNQVGGSPSKDHYEFQLIYLPDLTRQYGIKMTGGIGTLDGSINLEDGWKLTGLNVKSDSQTKDIISAAGTAITSITTGFKALKSANINNQPEVESEIWILRMNSDNSTSVIFHWPPK